MEAAQLLVSVKATGVQTTASQLGRVDAAGKRAAKGMDAFGASASNASRGSTRLGASALRLASYAGLGGIAVGAAKAAQAVVGFDQSMRNVNSIAGLTEERFKGLQKSVLNLAGPTGQAPKALADGLYQLVSSGFNAKDSLTILKSSASLHIVFDLPLDESRDPRAFDL